ncbi:MAG: hypothetical protein QM802_13165 [Agriterribacter sp.]
MSKSNNAPATNLVASPNYGKASKWDKAKRRINATIVNNINGTFLQFRWYRSYWHYKLFGNKNKGVSKNIRQTHFLCEKPNYGAGIGHQLANWNAGLYFAGYYNIRFAHYPFSTEKWESFLGFGEGEVKAMDLERDRKFKIVKLPRFNSMDKSEVDLIGKIIGSYRRKNILFYLETDQGYKRQCDTADILSEKFFNAEARKKDKLIFSKDSFNIAVHIRRRMKIETEEVWLSRGLTNQFFANALRNVLGVIHPDKKIEVYLFSQGAVEDFPEFKEFDNMHYCVDMGPIDSVLHMINADLLISSKSSFSYKPALISKGIKICPETFWHAYPSTKDFIMADNNGKFDKEKLLALPVNA